MGLPGARRKRAIICTMLACFFLVIFNHWQGTHNAENSVDNMEGQIPRSTSVLSLGVADNSLQGIVTRTGYSRPEPARILVGIPSVKRKGASYLLQTLTSLLHETFSEDRSLNGIVIFLADFDQNYNSRVLRNLTGIFKDYFVNGFISAIQVTESVYPNMAALESKYGDSQSRVAWRTKQVIDCAILCAYVDQSTTEYYLHLEDDVIVAKHPWPRIFDFIERQSSIEWTILEFSSVGFIGKMLKGRDLGKFSQYLMTFYNDMPVDWLLSYFRQISGQKNRVMARPSMFQHIGVISSLTEGNETKISKTVDDNFLRNDESNSYGDIVNPKAFLMSRLYCIGTHSLERAYHSKPSQTEYFWTKQVQEWDGIYMLFSDVVFPIEIRIVTGNTEHPDDILRHGRLEIATTLHSYDLRSRTARCSDFTEIARFHNGVANATLNSYLVYMRCMRLVVSANQTHPLLISHIYIRARHPDNNMWLRLFDQ